MVLRAADRNKVLGDVALHCKKGSVIYYIKHQHKLMVDLHHGEHKGVFSLKAKQRSLVCHLTFCSPLTVISLFCSLHVPALVWRGRPHSSQGKSFSFAFLGRNVWFSPQKWRDIVLNISKIQSQCWAISWKPLASSGYQQKKAILPFLKTFTDRSFLTAYYI